MRRPVPMAAAAVLAAWLAPTASPAGGQKTIEVISVTTYVHRVDQPPKGVSDGDRVESRDRLLNATKQFGLPSGARVGSDHGRFTYTSTHSASYAGEASLPGGTVTVRGAVLVRADGELMIPVVGGSGKYKGATGFVTIGPGKKRALNTYELTMSGANVA
jgi:allene oxide cyclase-like protein